MYNDVNQKRNTIDLLVGERLRVIVLTSKRMYMADLWNT